MMRPGWPHSATLAALALALCACDTTVEDPAGGPAGATCVRLREETRAFLEERPFSSGLTWAWGPTSPAGGASAWDGCWSQPGRLSDGARGVEHDVEWDLTLIESGFSACAVPAWINDTTRFQVGENRLFSVSRESCSRQGQYAPPAHRRRFFIFADYQVPDVELYRATELTGAWLVEPESLCPSCYEYVRNNLQSFDIVLSHDDELVAAANAVRPGKGIFCNSAIPSMDTSVFLDSDGGGIRGWREEKQELVSLIVSNKMSTSGHRLRHEALRVLADTDLHAYGGSVAGLRNLQDKVDALAPYMFHIVIENTPRECYFTEKLLDAIVLRAVPIYWGCARIGDIFDTAGILLFETSEELERIVRALSPELYTELLPAVERNWQLAVYAYSNMSPMHQLWFGGGQLLTQRLPRLVIFAPQHQSRLPLGQDVLLNYAVKPAGHRSGEGAEVCTVLLLVNGIFVRSLDECSGVALLEAAPGAYLQPGLNTMELILQVPEARGEEDRTAGVWEGVPRGGFTAEAAERAGGLESGAAGDRGVEGGDSWASRAGDAGGHAMDRVEFTLMHAIDLV